MALRIREPEISPRQALANIRARLDAAIKEGKNKAGATPKTEAVLEGVDAPDDEYGDDLDFSSLSEDEPKPSDAPKAVSDNEYGDDISFDELDKQDKPAPSAKDVKPAGQAPSAAPTTFNKPRRPSKAEQELLDKQLKAFERQRNADWNFSVSEISSELNSLFDLAEKNKQYLKDAGPIITEEELRSIFFAEYKNYQDKELKETTNAAIAAIPSLLEAKMPWLLDQFNARLHGNGEFLKSGSLMHYLIGAATRSKVSRTAVLRPQAKLVIHDKSTEDGISQFILSNDLNECENWVRDRFRGYDVSDSGIRDIALDILANGTNKPELVDRLGGRTNIPKKFSVPKYGSIERSGDDVVVLGPKSFVVSFYRDFEPYMDDADISAETLDEKIVPVTSVGGKKFHGGMYGIKINENKYLPIINRLAQEGTIVPISFGAGKVSTDQISKNDDGGDKNRAGENILTHRDEAGMSVINVNVGEQRAANSLSQLLNGPGARKVAQMSGTEDILNALVDGDRDIGKLSKFSAEIIKWLCDTLGREYTTKTVSGISSVVVSGEQSIIAQASKSIGLDTGTRAVLRAAVIFNNAMVLHTKDTVVGSDISDIRSMTPAEIRKNAMLDVHLDELARKCYDALGDGNTSGALVAFGRGYLVYMMGGLFEIQTKTPSLVNNASSFASIMGTKPMNRGMIHSYIMQLSPLDVVSMARRLEDAASDIMVGQEGGKVVYGDMYPECNVSMTKLNECGILQSVAYITDMDPIECICDTAETVCGMEPGTLTKYLNELKTCQDKDAIEDGAREINSKGNGVVDLHMSDAGKERVKNVPVGTHAAVKAKMPTRPNIQKIGRNRF